MMLVMLLGGLWHGAAWNFVVWGGIHGAVLSAERAWGRRGPDAGTLRPLRVAATFCIVLVSWVFFRATDLTSAVRYLHAMSGLAEASAGARLIDGLVYEPQYLVTVAASAAVVWTCPQTWDWTRVLSWPKVAAALALFAASAALLTTQAYNPFIYFIF
jgi:alginate O-acetyltransferase complex protein AlgI